MAARIASLVTLRLTMPARPPWKNPVEPDAPDVPELGAEVREPLWDPVAILTARIAIIASDSIEPPVWPTLIPRLDKKLSIFYDTFSIWASTSVSVMAKAGLLSETESSSTRSRGKMIFIGCFMMIALLK